jgi:excisionase family DNA binding protein
VQWFCRWSRIIGIATPQRLDKDMRCPIRLLTPEEVSERFQIKPCQVKQLARQGKIPAAKVGKFWRFPEDSLRDWMKNGVVLHNNERVPIDLIPFWLQRNPQISKMKMVEMMEKMVRARGFEPLSLQR